MLILGFSSCSDTDDNNITEDTKTIAGFVADNASYSILKSALDRTNLTSVFDGTDNFTVFAPNNDAFNAFLTANSFASIDDVPVDALSQILKNHVVSGTNLSSSLTTGYITTLATEATTSNNINMYVNTTSGVLLNGSTTVVTADVDVTNGVIHAVNSVIAIPTVVTFATADNTFTSLVAALTRENDYTYVATLSTANGTDPAPFTVFAPTDAAFAALLTELSYSSLSDIPTAKLSSVLNTHVVGGANVLSSALTDGMTVNTLGDSFVINTAGPTFTDQNERTGNIIVTDVQAGNGVIHVVDKVILPETN